MPPKSAPPIQELVSRVRDGEVPPVVLLTGSEELLVRRAVRLLRRAALGDESMAGFNADTFDGKGLDGAAVAAAARTLPMMADKRFVLVRDLEQASTAAQDAIAKAIETPSESTCLVLVAGKLDGRGKLAKAAKKAKVMWESAPLRGAAVREFAVGEAKARGHRLAPDAAAALLDALGEDLGAIDDALERLSLFVGAGNPIGLDAVEASVTRVRADSIWALVDAVSLKDLPRALGAASSLLADREPPLRILAMLARQLRMVARMREALASGLPDQDAARAAGAPPFKARDLKEAARRFHLTHLGRAFATLAEADQLLKGSRRPPDTILQEAVLRLCQR